MGKDACRTSGLIWQTALSGASPGLQNKNPALRRRGVRGGDAACVFCLVVLWKGKWKFEDLISHEDPQVKLLRVLVAFKPYYA